MAYIQLPNGKYIKIPEGMSPNEAYEAALIKFPNLLDEPQKKKGFGAALGKGFESQLSSSRTGLESLLSPNKAAEKGLQRSQELSEKYAEQVGLDPLKKAYEESGVIGAGGELLRQAPLAVAEQATNLATMYAGAKAGAKLPLPGIYGKAIGAGIGAFAPSLLQQFGSNVERQAAEQQEAGKPIDVSRGKALAAAVPQTALDVAATFIPLGGRIAGKVFGPEVEQLLTRGGTKAAEKLAQERLLPSIKNMEIGAIGKGLAIGAAAEIPTEITQQMLERLQAGLPLTSPEALAEYGEAAYQAGLVGGPLGAAGRTFDRAGAKGKIRAEEQAEQTRLAEEQAKLAEEEKLNKEAMEEMARIAAENPPKFGYDEEQINSMRKDIISQRNTFQNELNRLREEAQAESDFTKLTGITDRAKQIQAAINQLSPASIEGQIKETDKQIKALQKELKDAQKEENDDRIAEINTSLQTLGDKSAELKASLPAYQEVAKMPDGKVIKEQIAKKLEAIDKARESGDLEALGKLIPQIKALQAQYTGEQPSLFETTKQGFAYPEAERRETAEARALEETRPDMSLAAQKSEQEKRMDETMALLREQLPEVERKEREKIDALPLGELRGHMSKLEAERRELLKTNPELTSAVDEQAYLEAKRIEFEGGKKAVPAPALTAEGKKLAAIDDSILATQQRIDEEEMGGKIPSVGSVPQSVYELPSRLPSESYNRFADKTKAAKESALDELTQTLFNMSKGIEDDIANTPELLKKKIEGLRSGIVRNALREASARRYADGLELLTTDAALKLASRIDANLTELINRIPALPRKQVIDALGVAVEPRLITRGRPNEQAYARRQKELGAVREQLENVEKRIAAVLNSPRGKEAQQALSVAQTPQEIQTAQNVIARLPDMPFLLERRQQLQEREAVLEHKLRKDLTGEGLSAFVEERLGKITIDPRDLSERPLASLKRALDIIKEDIDEAIDTASTGRGKLQKVSPIEEGKLVQERDPVAGLKALLPKTKQVQKLFRELYRAKNTATPDAELIKDLKNQIIDKASNKRSAALYLEEIEKTKATETKEAVAKEKAEAIPPKEGGISRLQGELFPESLATIRATPQNFMRFLGSVEVFKMREKLGLLQKQSEEIQERMSKAPTLAALKAQRELVSNLNRLDQVVADYRWNMAQLWQGRKTIAESLNLALRELAVGTTPVIEELKRKRKKFAFKQYTDEYKNLSTKIQDLQNILYEQNFAKLGQIASGLYEFDATREERLASIDAIQERIDDLQVRNINDEKKILAKMERQYANQGTPSAKKARDYAAKVRAENAIEETNADIVLKKKVATKRVEEQQSLETREQLPVIRRVTEQTRAFTKSDETKELRAEKRKLEKEQEKYKPGTPQYTKFGQQIGSLQEEITRVTQPLMVKVVQAATIPESPVKRKSTKKGTRFAKGQTSGYDYLTMPDKELDALLQPPKLTKVQINDLERTLNIDEELAVYLINAGFDDAYKVAKAKPKDLIDKLPDLFVQKSAEEFILRAKEATEIEYTSTRVKLAEVEEAPVEETVVQEITPAFKPKKIEGANFKDEISPGKSLNQYIAKYVTPGEDGKNVGFVSVTEIKKGSETTSGNKIGERINVYDRFYKDFPFKKGSMDGKLFVHNLNVLSAKKLSAEAVKKNTKFKDLPAISYRKKGMAGALMDAVINYADKNNKTLFLIAKPEVGEDVNKDALSLKQLEDFYKKKGFVKRGDFMERAPQKIAKKTVTKTVTRPVAKAVAETVTKPATRITIENLKEKEGEARDALVAAKKELKELNSGVKTERNVKQVYGFEVGQEVSHPIFGKGLIKSLEGAGTAARARVDFENYGNKLLQLSTAKLKVYKTDKTPKAPKVTPKTKATKKELGEKIDELTKEYRELRRLGTAVEAAFRGAEDAPLKTARATPLKTGVRREITPKESTARAATRREYAEIEAAEAGISRTDFTNVLDGMERGFKAREEKAEAGTPLSRTQVNDLLSKIKMPKGLKVLVVKKITDGMANIIRQNGQNPATIRGWVNENGLVVIIAGNHTSIKDAEKTIAHELIGHVGVEGLLGEAGMRALAKKIIAQEGGVMALAEKLGVQEDAMGTYISAIQSGKTKEEAQDLAVRELIAHVEEATPTKSFLAKAGDFIKAMVGALRAALRKLGIDLDISTSDIYKLLRDARNNFDSITPGAYVSDGRILFRNEAPVANTGFQTSLSSTKGVIAEQKPLINRILGEATGMIFETKYVDQFAPMRAIAAKMADSLKATQMMYYLRMHGQRMSFVSEAASHGPLDLVKANDGKGFVIRSIEGANLPDMVKAVGKARVGNTEATKRVFSLWMAAQRAKTVGLNKLNFSGKLTQKMLDDVEKEVAADPQTAAAFKEASEIYAKYNEGLINFNVKMGSISKADAEAMLKNKNFIPYYRERPNTKEVFLEIGGAPAIKIGNLVDQPYLHELIGDDAPILDIFTSSLQNTSMLVDMALRNNATKEVANSLASLGMLKVDPNSKKDNGIHKGDGPQGPNVIRFKVDGDNYWAEVDTKTPDIPSEIVVKGLQGVNTSLPRVVEMMGGVSSFLRKSITRNPAYTMRQLIRDPMAAAFTAGMDTIPVASSIKEVANMWRGKSEGETLLRRSGILGGQILQGTAEDMQKILNDLLSGNKGWDYRMAQLDMLSIQGDAATRIVMYNNFIKQGLSDLEATYATLEAMNFSKRGISPSLFQLSIMVPFMNAQIQGLNVLYKAFKGDMPFNEKLKVKQKLYERAMMMAGFTAIYAALMQDDEAYQNANDDEKYSNWFFPNPFGEEHIKIPIPFEVGLLFKAVPEALVNTIFGDAKAKDTFYSIAKMAWNNVPNVTPTAIKPIVEVATNYSVFTGRDIENARMQQYEPGLRYNERTTEIAKSIGGMLNISPTKIEYLIKGYTGSMPLALASMTNPILRSSEGGERPDARGLVGSETPLIGTFFQPKDAGGLINKAYADMRDVVTAKQSYNKLLEDGREKEAQDYLDANADVMAMSSLAGKFRQQMGVLTKQERAIRSATGVSGKEKREALDELRQAKIELAKEFSNARE